MKLFYTDMTNHLTEKLSQLAFEESQRVKRVFYISPNSLSFEKEKAVLKHLPRKASLSILVTRFSQMARYFIYHHEQVKKGLDDIGLHMIFHRALSTFSDTDLVVYGKVKTDQAFIQELINLYKELQEANLSLSDLEKLPDEAKKNDLINIFYAVNQIIINEGYEHQTKLAQFRQLIETGSLDEQLSEVVIIIDGFTRFSADEEALIASLHERVSEIYIGTYASQKAMNRPYIEGNVYQSSVELLRHFATTYRVKPHYFFSEEGNVRMQGLVNRIESHFDYSELLVDLSDEDRNALEIWDVTSQKEEIEQVAISIRQLLFEGVRYKDILVLLGDVDSYHLQIGTIFQRYEIPYYFGKVEEMSSHPLVHLIESLERIKRYRFRTEDVLNLLKSGLYAHTNQTDMDYFESYLLFADIKGQVAFSREFSINNRTNYDLTGLNQLRERLLTPLIEFMQLRPQTGQSLLEKWLVFLENIDLSANMSRLSEGIGELEQEKEAEVWKAFCHLLEQFQQVFAKEVLTVEEFLNLLRVGIQASHYRIIPATVDVVNIKGYDLIEPYSAKYVFALGLNQGNFPKIAKGRGLLTDEEKELINATSGNLSQFHIVHQENIKKNHFMFLSLLHSATSHLVLSSARLYNEDEAQPSPYLKLLQSFGIPTIEKGGEAVLRTTDIGHYKGVLSRIIATEPKELDNIWTQEERTFWTVLVRYLKNKLEKEGLVIPTITHSVTSTPLATDTLHHLFPADQPLHMSASSLTDFYKNEYLYFIKHILKLKEMDSIKPDSRSHGNFLHRIFERITMDTRSIAFDKKMEEAIQQTRREKDFVSHYQVDAEGVFSEGVLLDIARASSYVLREESPVEVIANEAAFGKGEEEFLELEDGRLLKIIGKIDRLDRLQSTHSIGVVDYKSSSNQFHIDRFYNGLSPQLVTYLSSAHQVDGVHQTDSLFGAMYLHLLDPIVKLSDISSRDFILSEVYKSLVYKGIFVEEESQALNHLYSKTKASVYSKEELEILIKYNEQLYRQAANRIVSGHYAVNPYTRDGKSVEGEQLKAITGFEADRHLGQARRLTKHSKREEWLKLMKGEEG